MRNRVTQRPGLGTAVNSSVAHRARKLARKGAREPRSAVVLVSETVAVQDIRVDAFIGVYPEERRDRQRLMISATIELRRSRIDSIGSTFDYSLVTRAAEELGREHTNLIETFAHRLSERLLESRWATRVFVQVDKPDALANGRPLARVEMWKNSS